jgi:hypothetical protein
MIIQYADAVPERPVQGKLIGDPSASFHAADQELSSDCYHAGWW